MGKRNVPEVCFAGFAGDWEERKLGEMVLYEQPTKYIVRKVDYDDRHETPVLTAGQSFILGYTNETEDIYKANVDKPVIIFDDFTTSSHFVDFPFKVKSSAMKILRLNQENSNFYFAYNLMKKINYIPQNHERHWISKFSKFEILVPSLEEQTKIGNFFKSLDRLITLRQQKYDKLVTVKKSMLGKMFPKEGETVPEVRFTGFSGEWEERKLGEVCNIVTGKLDANAMIENGKYDFYTSGMKKYKINVAAFKGPAITIAGNGATVGYMHYANGEFNAYQRTYVLTQIEVKRSFLFPELAQKLQIKINREVRAGNIPYIVMGMLSGLDIVAPNCAEQTAIGNFFKSLDSLITLQDKELEKLKNIKKSLLDKMFI